MADIDDHRLRMRQALAAGEDALVAEFKESIGLDAEDRAAIAAQARALVERIRAKGGGGLVETFLARFPLGSREGQALMGLAEALLRVPDAPTADALLDDKIRQGEWHREAGTRGLRIEAMVAALALARHLLAGPAMVEAGIRPLIRLAASRLVHLFGGQFVFAPDIDQAVGKARVREHDGVRFSYDMLGEAARTAADADRYFRRYRDAIARIAGRHADLDHNAAMSVKLSALHPRYEYAQQDRLQAELVPRVIALARAAKAANIGMTIDAEEAERLDLSLDVIAEVAADPQLAGWNGLGIVVQAYGKRALPLIAWADALARRHDRRIMVRLVKGAYWDSEIKRAQVLGLAGFPVFTRKAATDLSYLAAARSLLTRSALYPQFATHNAQTAAAVLHLARKLGVAPQSFEMQRLHGMGAELHRLLRQDAGTRTRIYAPVGPYRDLLPYLVRRLLENGASASFVQQLASRSVPVAEIIADPAEARDAPAPGVQTPDAIFAPSRRNSRGIDLSDPPAVDDLLAACAPFRGMRWMAAPLINGARCEGVPRPVMNPAAESEVVGFVAEADADQVAAAVEGAAVAWPGWAARSVSERTAPLRAAADLYEQNRPELISLLVSEAGKTLPDAVAEVREAVDFLRYYAGEAERHPQGEGRGVFACISPWNFPLAIFTGQIAAALAAGNAVIAKPAQQTPLIAFRAVQLLHAAGVPASVLHCLPGDGARVGDALTRERRLAGVAFTGSLATARRIETQMAHHLTADAPLIAETGGLNAMIVDSTALPEQVVRDVLASAFQSAGQRCSALRVLYLQQDIAAPVLEMLSGAMNELRLGDPWELSTDIGPVIDAGAARRIKHHVDSFAGRGSSIMSTPLPAVEP